jgi:hypothetical protein
VPAVKNDTSTTRTAVQRPALPHRSGLPNLLGMGRQFPSGPLHLLRKRVLRLARQRHQHCHKGGGMRLDDHGRQRGRGMHAGRERRWDDLLVSDGHV